MLYSRDGSSEERRLSTDKKFHPIVTMSLLLRRKLIVEHPLFIFEEPAKKKHRFTYIHTHTHVPPPASTD
jgi:hypothetical protein